MLKTQTLGERTVRQALAKLGFHVGVVKALAPPELRDAVAGPGLNRESGATETESRAALQAQLGGSVFQAYAHLCVARHQAAK